MHALTWQTAALFLIFALLLALAVTWILRASWRFGRPTFEDKRIKGHHHQFRDNLRVSANSYMHFHNRGEAGIRSEVVRNDIARDSNRYYVVTVVDREKRKAVLYRELRLQPGQSRGALETDLVQFDQEVLTNVRLANGYDDDDEPGINISGRYDIYVRKVQWYDIRHWLLHPNREIRIAVWVTLITTFTPTFIDILFG